MNEEVFKDIENYEGLYQVSNFGRVYGVKRGKYLKPQKDTGNYLFVKLCKDGKAKGFLVHRLVAKAFLPNPSNLPQINHISEIKSDNRVENLEYCTCEYNNNYGSHNERVKQKLSKLVLQFTRDNKLVNEFPSTREAERATGINNANISKCCRGNYSHVGGFVWRYKNVG